MIHDPVRYALQVAVPVFFASSDGGGDGGELLSLFYYDQEFRDGQQHQLGYGLNSSW